MRIAILGTGAMAATHAQAYRAMDGVELVAGIDSNPARLAAFQEQFGIPQGFESIEDALAVGGFDAVSNVTPDPVHKVTTLPILAAGKHVLCEKPLALTEDDAREMAEAAKAAGVVHMVNLSYRDSPALVEATRLVRQGAIGEIRHFEASYLQSWLTQSAWGDWRSDPTWLWRLSTLHGSLGVLGDVGIHILDFATFIAGSEVAAISARLKTFDKAEGGQIGAYRLDANDSATMQVELANGALGVIHASRFASGHFNDLRLRLYGTKGGIDVQRGLTDSALSICTGSNLDTAKWETVSLGQVPTNYTRFIEACRLGTPVEPDFERGALLQTALDRAFQSNADGSRMLPVTKAKR